MAVWTALFPPSGGWIERSVADKPRGLEIIGRNSIVRRYISVRTLDIREANDALAGFCETKPLCSHVFMDLQD
jgi:hypothetical protein